MGDAQADHETAAPIPAALSSLEAAPLLCAGLTVHHALKQCGVRAGQRIGVFAVGGLGHLAVQLARALGAEVGAVDVSAAKREHAAACGAHWTVHAPEQPVHRAIRARGGLHVAMVTAGSHAAYETALRCLRRGGALSVVGMAPEPIPVSASAIAALRQGSVLGRLVLRPA